MNANRDSDVSGLPAPIPAPPRTLELIPKVEWTEGAEFAPRAEPAPKPVWRRRLGVAAAILAVAAGASGVTLAVANRHEAAQAARSAEETQTLAKSVVALAARLDSVEKTKSREAAADFRKAVGDLKSASSRDLDSALARVTQRIDALDREQTAKVEKVDRSTDFKAAEFAARLDKLEKRVASAPQTVPARPAPQVAGAKAAGPKPGPNVSMEPTGSIRPPVERPVLRGYVVLGARPDAALIGDAWGERAVRIGDFLPGAGRVERIERQGPAWIVQTNAGVIPPVGAAME